MTTPTLAAGPAKLVRRSRIACFMRTYSGLRRLGFPVKLALYAAWSNATL